MHINSVGCILATLKEINYKLASFDVSHTDHSSLINQGLLLLKVKFPSVDIYRAGDRSYLVEPS